MRCVRHRENKTAMAGRKTKYESLSAKKTARRQRDKARQETRIAIKDQKDRWNCTKDELGCQTDEEMAKYLLDL
jgi:hypothetical protein